MQFPIKTTRYEYYYGEQLAVLYSPVWHMLKRDR